MKEWFSAQELAGKPGQPSTDRGVNKLAARENWVFRKKETGKGKEYHINSFPPETQAFLEKMEVEKAANALLQQSLTYVESSDATSFLIDLKIKHEQEIHARQKRKQEGLAKFATLSKDSDKYQRAKARKWLVLALAEYTQNNGGVKIDCRHAFVEAVNQHLIDVPAHVKQWIPMNDGHRQLAADTLKKWTRQYEKNGTWGLVDGYGKRKGQSKITANPALYKVVIGCMIQKPYIKAIGIKQYLEAGHADLNVVSMRGIQRFMKEWKDENAQLWTYITNPDKWKNIYMAAPGSHFENINELNQLWEMDSTPGDWLLKDGRHSVIGVIDLWSRRLKLYVSKTSKAIAVCQLFRRSVLDWGVPWAVRTDNGKDYVSNQFSGVLQDLEIQQEICIPFASEEKGTIERALQTMSHGILELLPGFIGHNVAERKEIEARKSFAQRIMKPGEVVEVALTSEELQEKLDQWTEHIYAHNPHSGLKGKTPFERYSEWEGSVRRIEDDQALDMLLAEVAGRRTITKKGIRFDSHNYFSEELFWHAGREALLKYDEQDIGRLYVYVDGEFVCTAVCHEILGISRKESAVAAKAKQKKLMAAQSREYREYSKEIKKNIAETVLEHRIEQSEKLTAFPKRTEVHASDGLEAARDAVLSQLPAPPVPELSESEKAEREEIERQLAEITHLQQSKEEDSDEALYERWHDLHERISSGEQLQGREAVFYDSFPLTPEYVTLKQMEEMGMYRRAQVKA